MKKFTLVFLLIIPAFLIVGCSQNIVVSKINSNKSLTIPLKLEYSNYREALQNFDFSYLDSHPVNAEQIQFAKALKLVFDGNFENAEKPLNELLATTRDTLIKADIKDILSSIYFYQSKWSACYKTDTTNVLAKAFSQSPDEVFLFPSEPVVVPLSFSMTGQPILEVTINGQKKRFWLDTGAGMTVLPSDIAELCHVTPINTKAKTNAATSTSKTVDIEPVNIDNITIDGFAIKNHKAFIIDKNNLKLKFLGITFMKIDGIIGWNAIQNMNLVIDYKQKKLTIRKPVKQARIDRNFYWFNYPVVKTMTNQGVATYFGLDTGANSTHLSENIFRKDSSLTDTFEKTNTVGGAGGTERKLLKYVKNCTVILGDYSFNFKKISVNKANYTTFFSLDGVIGSDIFKSGSVNLDITNGRMVFESEEIK